MPRFGILGFSWARLSRRSSDDKANPPAVVSPVPENGPEQPSSSQQTDAARASGSIGLHVSKTQRIRDPVHGLIVFGASGNPHRDETDAIAWRLLDTPEFQRLRRIRQLGFSDLVFPGATHSRFAHSLGVYCIARQLADVIARQVSKPDPDRERVALLAALLHDIGHGPFSHAFEAAATATGQSKRHEDWSAEIIQGSTAVNRVLRDVDEELPQTIGALLKVFV